MIAAPAPCVFPASTPGGGLLDTLKLRVTGTRSSIAEWGRHTVCGLRGHAMLMHFEPTRLSLQCMSCGHTTPGWMIQGRS
jgi:hypothetical protein